MDQKIKSIALEFSEKRLNSQMGAALAADARAMSFSAIMVAAAAILAGLAEDSSSPLYMLAGAILLLVSAALAGYSARPVSFYMPGAKYSDVLHGINDNTELEAVVDEIGGFNDENSDHNDKVMKRNSSVMRMSFVISLVGVSLATLPQLPGATPANQSNGDAQAAVFIR